MNLTCNSSKWSDIVVLAESEKEKFADVEILTIKEYNYQQALERAFQGGATIRNVEQIARRSMTSFPVYEFIDVLENKLRVVINADRVDDNAIQRVISILTQVQAFEPGARITFHELFVPCKTIN